MAKFEIGQAICTTNVANKMRRDNIFKNFVYTSLGRYKNADWGDTCADDALLNNKAIESGERIFAVYIHEPSNTTIWIITEADRSRTTILFPDEY